MNIIKNGVELDGEEMMNFFDQHCEVENFVYNVKDIVVGDITAITHDNRFVLDVDNGTGVELYSRQYKTVAVQRMGSSDMVVTVVE